MSSPNVSSDLDLLPTTLLKACLDSVLGQITNVTVLSLNSGQFPDDFKHGHVNPVLKKVSLPKDDLNNYNISIIPKVVASYSLKSFTQYATDSVQITPFYRNCPS